MATIGLGETRDDIRRAGMGIVVEYAGQQGDPRWVAPPETLWDYRPFAKAEAAAVQPDVKIPLVFVSKFRGHGDLDYWMINGKSYPDTDMPVQVFADNFFFQFGYLAFLFIDVKFAAV